MELVLVLVVATAIQASSRAHTSKSAGTGVLLLRDSSRHSTEVYRGIVPQVRNVARRTLAIDFIDTNKSLFGLIDPTAELRFDRERSDNLGTHHLEFTQVYNNLEVWGCRKFVHFDSSGSIYLVAGQNIATPRYTTVPKIAETIAEQIALANVNSSFSDPRFSVSKELIIYPNKGSSTLAWLVTIRGTNVEGIRYRVFVDAQTGEILHKFNDIHFDGPAYGSGTDLDGVNRELNTYLEGSNFKLIDASRTMFKPPIADLNGVIATYWNKHHFGNIVTDTAGDNSFNNGPGFQAAVSAHYYAEKVYEYFLHSFGFESLSNTGASMLVNVHDSIFQNNAYWDGTSVSFSDGDGVNWRPFCADIDVVGHEFTHALTEYTAGLVYEFESGALNESMSDFFGNMVDRSNWLIGDNVRITSPGFMRSMAEPHRGPDSARFPFGNQPAHMSEFVDTNIVFDNGGVHINSGIPNHVGYLMGESIGRDKAEQIWFRTLTTYLTPSSSFQFWSIMLTQSAEDLFGVGSSEAIKTIAALDSVGFGLLEVSPSVITQLRRVLGTTKNTYVTVKNRRIEDVTILSTSVSGLGLSISGALPVTLHRGDSIVLVLTIDGIQASECDLGLSFDTLRVQTSVASESEIIVPIEITTAYADVGVDTTTLQTGCLVSEVFNDPGMLSFGVPGLTMLNRGSLVIGWVNGADTIVYWHIDRPSTYLPIDSFSRAVSPAGDSLLSFRFMSDDGVIHGLAQYRYSTSPPNKCRHIIADYWLTRPCGDPITIYSGTYLDWDIDTKNQNTTDWFNVVIGQNEDTVYRSIHITKAPLLGVSAGQMVLGHDDGTAYVTEFPGYKTIWLWLYDHLGFTSELLFRDLTPEGFSTSHGSALDDWASLATYGANQIGPADTVHLSVAYLWTVGNDSTYLNQLAGIPPTCCADYTGNVDCDPEGHIDISDVSRLIDRLYGSFLPLCCKSQANVDGVESIDISDLISLIDRLYINFTPTAACKW